MKTLYLDCGMGAAGDMLTAALLELFEDRQGCLDELNHLGLPGIRYEAEPSVKCGITGTHMHVYVHGEEEETEDVDAQLQAHTHEHHEHHHDDDHEFHHEHEHHHDHEEEHDHHHEHEHDHHHEHEHDHHHEHEHDHHHEHEHDHEYGHEHGHHHSHSHSSMHDIEHIVRDHIQVSDKVREDILAVYTLIAQAESKAHGCDVSEIHFHEVGSMDAIADVTAVCYLMDKIAPDKVVVSPVHVGSGKVRCAHGILPVPAPATAHILMGIPTYGGAVEGELCTPTGAALVKHFADSFGSMPVMRVQAIGYGMGKKDFAAANCVRSMLGESDGGTDEILELSCNVDDMSGEAIGFAMERLMEAGARDAWTVSVGMKKCRPGVLIRVICTKEKKEEMVRLLFRHTSTIGIRETSCRRYILDRSVETVETDYGPVRVKTSSGYGVTRRKPEYEDLADIARREGISIAEIVRHSPALGLD